MNAAPALPGVPLPATDTPAGDGGSGQPCADPGLFVALLAGLLAPPAPAATPSAEAPQAEPADGMGARPSPWRPSSRLRRRRHPRPRRASPTCARHPPRLKPRACLTCARRPPRLTFWA